MNLQNLKIWMKSNHINGPHRFLRYESLLLPLRQLSSNNFFVPTYVHENLTHLNVNLNGIHHLLNIVQNKSEKITLQLLTISFDEDIWSTIQRYKNTFDSFNVYISFRIKEGYNLEEFEHKFSSSNQFVFDNEDEL